MKIKGIKRGQIIELLEQVDSIPDGIEIVVDLQVDINSSSEVKQPLTDEERLAKLNQLFGDWKDQPELVEIFAEIDKERHIYYGREIAGLSHSPRVS